MARAFGGHARQPRAVAGRFRELALLWAGHFKGSLRKSGLPLERVCSKGCHGAEDRSGLLEAVPEAQAGLEHIIFRGRLVASLLQ